MGLSSSKEQSMAKAIENHDLDGIKTMINDLGPESMRLMCKSLVPDNENQCTMLHYATWQDNPQLLELFLEYADDLEIQDGLGWTPLITAVNRNSIDNIRILLKCGAKIDCDGVYGMDLIATAMSFDDLDLVQLLMDHGARVTFPSDAQTSEKDSNQCHLLHFAADGGLTNITRLLIEKGQMSVNTIDQSGWSPLHLAAGHNHLDIVKLLLQNGADVNIKDNDGNTPLAWARITNAEEVINELEKHGGIADDEWHGEKPQLIHPHEETEEHQELHGIDNSQFEIEDSGVDNLITHDALQRRN